MTLPAAPFAQGASSDFRGIINLPEAQASYPYRGDGYSVAILDTGINYNLPDLGGGWGHRVIAGWNFINNTSDPMDDNGHGTFVAGEIGSSSSTSAHSTRRTARREAAISTDSSRTSGPRRRSTPRS